MSDDGPDAFAREVGEHLAEFLGNRLHRPSVEVTGVFPDTEIVVRAEKRGYRNALFRYEDGAVIGSWPEITSRLAMYRDARQFAAELWVDIEEGFDSSVWAHEWSDPDDDGVRWVAR